MTQVYLSGQGTLGSKGPAETLLSSEAAVDMEAFRGTLVTLLVVFSFFSLGVMGVAAAPLPQSKALPGVFGVLAADPNDAKAPDPRPKALEPPVVGEFKPGPVRGEIALNGFARPPWDDVSPPKRFEVENVRVGGSFLSPWWSDMDRDSLLVLERRVHRFSLLSIGDVVAGT